MQRPESDFRPKLVHPFFVHEFPRANAAVYRIIQPLCPIALGTTLLHGNAVFQVSAMPSRYPALFCAFSQQTEALSLKCGIADSMLGYQPCCFCAIFACELLIRPAMQLDELGKTLCISDMNSLHPGYVASPEFAGIKQFLPNSQILGPHGNKFVSERVVQNRLNCIRADWGEEK